MLVSCLDKSGISLTAMRTHVGGKQVKTYAYRRSFRESNNGILTEKKKPRGGNATRAKTKESSPSRQQAVGEYSILAKKMYELGVRVSRSPPSPFVHHSNILRTIHTIHDTTIIHETKHTGANTG